MPEPNDLFDINRKHLTGKLLTSTVSGGTIADITMPGETRFRHMLVLSASDFENAGDINVMDDRIPFFARDEIAYKGQPILAVFGYEPEDVELFCREVKFSYQIKPESGEHESKPFESPFIWSYGNTDEYFTEKAKTFASSFEVTPFSNTMLGNQKIFAVESDGKINIRIASQWPVHVRKCVAKVLGRPLEDIIVQTQPYYAPFDQLIVIPSLLACIASLAAVQSGELVQLSSPMVSWQPRMKIDHETAYTPDGNLLADRASCTIDMGAFPIFAEEVCHNVLAGLISAYPMKAADVSIHVTRSSSPPANFFGDLGYAMALAGTENHFSLLASSLGLQPALWREENLKTLDKSGFPLCRSVKQSSDFDKLKNSVKSVVDRAWYSRKYASNAQSRLLPVKMNPFINYSRGIGIASGEGIMGFSQQFNAGANYTLSLTMNEDETLTVNTGMQVDKSMSAIWKTVIRRMINISDENILFMDINDSEILDIGPSALSRKIGVIEPLLMKAGLELSRKIQFSRLPVTASAGFEAELTDPFYFSSGIGAVAVELHIDTVMLSPIIDNVWVDFHLGQVFDMDKLLKKARHTITMALSDICPRSSAKCIMDIKISKDGSFAASSLTAALRGLTTSALVSALSQALGYPIHKIPVTSDDILAIANRNSNGDEK
ncbi:MAG: molybdopterin cofactor-binding domain-containing protein [Sphaerochaeta sp.]